MTLQVTERQSVEQWYELSGAVEAKELFPTLLPNSESLKEVEDIQTEPEGGANAAARRLRGARGGNSGGSCHCAWYRPPLGPSGSRADRR